LGHIVIGSSSLLSCVLAQRLTNYLPVFISGDGFHFTFERKFKEFKEFKYTSLTMSRTDALRQFTREREYLISRCYGKLAERPQLL
jgi:hypothetical protein